MTERKTDYGRLIVGNVTEIFTQAVTLSAAQQERAASPRFTLALTGGSTPQQWYQWCVGQNAIPARLAEAHFTVSDERDVPLESPQSNFGNAERLLLGPLQVPAERRHPWPVGGAPAATAAAYREQMRALCGAGRTYDVCMLGMGDDAHTASLFPQSPLLTDDGGELFAAVDAGDRGWRLTITPTGLRACGLIVLMTLGANKAPALKRIFTAPYDPLNAPSQILKTCADRVVWLVDEAAASAL